MRGAYLFLTAISAALSAFAQTPVINDNGIVNSVTQDRNQAVSAGSIVSIFGTELASAAALADSVPLSTSVAGITVTINNVNAPIRQVSSTLISVQIPWEVQDAKASVVVNRNGVASTAKSVNLAQFSPGVYAINSLAVSNLALALNSDGSLAQPTGSIAGLNAHPANIGDTVVILATGLGPVDPPAITGAKSDDVVRNVITSPQVLLQGIAAPLVSATLSPNFVGAYQVQITIPDSAPTGSAIPIQLQIADATSPNTTTMAVAAPQASVDPASTLQNRSKPGA